MNFTAPLLLMLIFAEYVQSLRRLTVFEPSDLVPRLAEILI